jgi:hypothetical protein
VKVLSGSADGEKFFGEVGKKKGWFPQIYVKREAAGGIVQSFRPSGADSGDGDSSPPAISGPTHVRQHSQNLETLSLLADQLPPNVIAVRAFFAFVLFSSLRSFPFVLFVAFAFVLLSPALAEKLNSCATSGAGPRRWEGEGGGHRRAAG